MILGRLRAYVETESCSVLIVDAMKASKQLNKVYLETVDIDVILDALLEAKNRRSQSFFKRFLSYFVLFIAISAISGSNHWNQISDSLHQVWQNNIAPFISGGYKQCAVALPDFFEDVLRPPINCSFCIGLESIDVVSNLSIETFEKEYAYTGRPVVVTNDQSIRQSASFSFQLFKNLSKAHRLKSCQYFPYKTEFDTLEEALNMDEGRSNLRPGYVPWYIGWSICELKYINRLKNYVAIPSFLSPESDIKQTLWIFMGTPGHGAPMHIYSNEKKMLCTIRFLTSSSRLRLRGDQRKSVLIFKRRLL
ncbi:uncharacterized protein LOC126897571 isoform X2 [Daktulosphaira vitifoliae]|uniref:uncharacterized protein LOC126897571 isoform X2 n=1 Tax=Daktulosphaira vitifoliae TaxID=58002 RepID=UPI0021AA43DC|nr:uncharacterized protein LOC126897571 isoform X2 [Daktulosphaira vitifoliae]